MSDEPIYKRKPKHKVITWAVQTRVTAIAWFDSPPPPQVFTGDVRRAPSAWIFFFGIKKHSDGPAIGRFRVMFTHGRNGRAEIDLEAQMMRRSLKWGRQNGVELHGGRWFPLDGDNGILVEAFAQFEADRDSNALAGMKSNVGMDDGRQSRWGDTDLRIEAVQRYMDDYRRRAPLASNNVIIRAAVEQCQAHPSESFIRRYLRIRRLTIPPKVATH